MATIVKKDYNSKKDFWEAVRTKINICKGRPAPSGYHKFSGTIFYEDGALESFSSYKKILSNIGKYYYKIKSVEINFRPAPFGQKPRFW